MEVSTAGWFASANVALGISNSAFTWYQSLSMKAVASGDMLTTSALSQAPTVVADTEYVAHTMVSPAVAALTFRIQIHWRDAGGTDISVSSADWTPPSGQWTRVSVVAVAPPGAVLARVAFAPTATAAGQEWLVDRVVLAPTSAVSTAGNLLPYNVSSMEQDISGWTITAGTATQSRTQVFNGGYSLRAEADGTADMQISTTVPVAGITPGFGHQFTPPIYRGAGVTRAYATQLEWLSATDEVLRTRWQIWGGVSEAWVLGSLGDLAPEGAVSVRLSVVVPGATAGEVWYLDRVHLGLGGLTCHAVEAPGGGAALTVRGLTTGGPTWIWSLTRVVAGEQPRPVRGWDGDLSSKPTTSDTYVITDYEAPLGVPVSWRIWTQTPTLTASLTYLSVEVTLDAPELAVWLTDPGSPARAAQVTVGTPMPAWARSARQNTSHVRQRAMPVVISDVRVGRTGQLSLVTADTSERDALWWILEAGGPLLLRWPPRFGERDMYVSVGEVSETRVTDFAEHADRTWTLALTEIDRPPGGITGSADRTWQTVRDSGATWAEALAGSMTWLDVYTGGS
ncbi:hypothetical protein [Streptomyces albipurpureus]|uniref:Minor tail protein n=1 Tax=Streptomyces albipurpureus TaxID=2897419 RepID=A0ABT0USZ2_9ACTN|nr:hypothetical protein [Streptomyces sp. CWNU-1]MCM2391714.1 hypothetical protein [Streptomyces sp. CWNU-1]